MSALPPESDILRIGINVCKVPVADIAIEPRRTEEAGREMGRRACVNVCLWHLTDVDSDAQLVRFQG